MGVKKWNVYGVVRATKFLGTFEAETAEQAEELAMEQNGHVSVCHQCSSEVEDPEIDRCVVEPELERDDAPTSAAERAERKFNEA